MMMIMTLMIIMMTNFRGTKFEVTDMTEPETRENVKSKVTR